MEQYGGMSAQISGGIDRADEPGAFAILDEQLEALGASIERLSHRLGPILNQYATAEMANPRSEPPTQFRAKIEVLADLRHALDDIASRIDL